MATLTTTSKLDAVNSILIGIGEAPVNSVATVTVTILDPADSLTLTATSTPPAPCTKDS